VIAEDPAELRRLAWRGLAAGLCVAALAAIVALLRGSFDDTELRVVLTSIGFAVFSSLTGAAATARLSRSAAAHSLGLATIVLAGAAFVLLVIGLWTGDWGSEGVWRSFGVAAVLAVATAHAAVVLASARPTDGEAIRALTGLSICFGALDAIGALLPIAGIVDEFDEDGAKLLAVGLVLLLLTTALPPILRRIARPAAPRGGGDGPLGERILEIADRLDELNAGPGNRAPEIRAEVDRLRRLGRSIQA
jgi:hypothetical protein